MRKSNSILNRTKRIIITIAFCILSAAVFAGCEANTTSDSQDYNTKSAKVQVTAKHITTIATTKAATIATTLASTEPHTEPPTEPPTEPSIEEPAEEPSVNIIYPDSWLCISDVPFSKWVDSILADVYVDSVTTDYYSHKDSVTARINLLISPREDGQVGVFNEKAGWTDQRLEFIYTVTDSRGVVIKNSSFSISNTSPDSTYAKHILVFDLTPDETYELSITGEGIWKDEDNYYVGIIN